MKQTTKERVGCLESAMADLLALIASPDFLYPDEIEEVRNIARGLGIKLKIKEPR